MQHIYSKATEVIVWLGHDISDEMSGFDDFLWAATTFKDAVEKGFGKLGSGGSPIYHANDSH